MPIIVDEVVVSIEVGTPTNGGGPSKSTSAEAQQQVVQQCVERVLEVLRVRTER